MVFLNKKGEP